MKKENANSNSFVNIPWPVVCQQLGKIPNAVMILKKSQILGFSQNMGTRLPFNPLALDPGSSRLPRRHSSSLAYHRDTGRVNITLLWLHLSDIPDTNLKENMERGRFEGHGRRRQGSVTWDLTTQVQSIALTS